MLLVPTHSISPLTNDLITALATFGVIGQAIILSIALATISAIFSIRSPLEEIRSWLYGYELWLAFLVSAAATVGSLFLSEVAHFQPCDLCWFQRGVMYPLVLGTLFAAISNDFRGSRLLLPFAFAGAGISFYQMLLQYHVLSQPSSCRLSAPGGCATLWIDKFGYMTIPTLSFTAFSLIIAFLALGAFSDDNGGKSSSSDESV